MSRSPSFGEADLTNCERELIHLAGSIQPHGILLTLTDSTLEIAQASSNSGTLIRRTPEQLLNRPLATLGGNVEAQVRSRIEASDLREPRELGCTIQIGERLRRFEGVVHRAERHWLVLELEPADNDERPVPTAELAGSVLREHLEKTIESFSAASTISTLADSVVQSIRHLTGYDRVMVYRFDPEGHGKIIAEARHARLESLLGHHYPASDIPERARQLYVRNRLRLLADVDYAPALLEPRELPGTQAGELDMSMCYLRSMSPLHLQYLKNMGVTATLVISIVRGHRLWGLIAAHHYDRRNLPLSLRAACDMLGEVVATRLAAIENYSYAQVAIQAHRLEQRLVEATSTNGDWRVALFRNPGNILQPVEATGAALFYQGDVLTAGEVPSTPELHALCAWIETIDFENVFNCSSVARANPDLAALTPTASGILAVRLSESSSEYLMWFRKEQIRSVTWAGDPSKPVVGNDPSTLSPRRSFAAWSELVQKTALPWTSSELALARALGSALVEIIGRINAVQFLIAQHQLFEARERVLRAKRALLLIDAHGQALVASDAYHRLFGRVASQTTQVKVPEAVNDLLRDGPQRQRSWQARIEVTTVDGRSIPVQIGADSVPSGDGKTLGYFVFFDDLTEAERTDKTRRALEQTFENRLAPLRNDRVVAALYANASLAAMDIADGHVHLPAAAELHEVEASAHRAERLYDRVRAMLLDNS